jgi:hydroxymethylglutaryl-CoA lyase
MIGNRAMKLVECPRDAMQGLENFIPTHMKIRYLNQLLKVGFDTIDFGSFVSPKAIPQMRDSAEVLAGLNFSRSSSKLLAIVANERGAEEAAKHNAISYLGFPLSLSETFQRKNTNKTIVEALNTVEEIQNICKKSGKTLVTYLSMGFGNPYGDPYDAEIVGKFVDIMVTMEVEIISLADTVGVATADQVRRLFAVLSGQFTQVELGVHLHSNPATAREKVAAAHQSGCRRFDGAMRGFGGCPMAEDKLVGNIATETIYAYLRELHEAPVLDDSEFQKSMLLADQVFGKMK